MSTIDVFQVLRKIPEVSEQEAQAAADTIANADDVVTKADLKTAIAELETQIQKQLTAHTAITIGALGLLMVLLKFFE